MSAKQPVPHRPRVPRYGRDQSTNTNLFLVGCTCNEWVAPGDGPIAIGRPLRECMGLWREHVEAVAA